MGESHFRLSNLNVEYQYNIINYEQLNEISSKLRVHAPAFNGVADLIRYLSAPFDKHQNQTSLEVARSAPLFNDLLGEDDNCRVTRARHCTDLRAIGFFDTGQATAQFSALEEVVPIDGALCGRVTASIPWPSKSTKGTLFLYFRNHEVGSVSVHRWLGTPNWRIQVQEFFDPGLEIFKRGINA